MVAQTCPIMIPRGRWFLSLPVSLTALISAVLTLVLFLPTTVLTDNVSSQTLAWVIWAVAATVMGFACGFLRERSSSVVPAMVVHATGLVAVWVVLNVLAG
jgi:membrane protease YdiL (CAAX protease family)